jgi:hypothetical protein
VTAAAAQRRALAAGCDAFLLEPLRIDALLDLVHRFLRESDPEREADRRGQTSGCPTIRRRPLVRGPLVA